MSQSNITPKELYLKISNKLFLYPEITQNKRNGFGSGLRANGKVFAMLSKDELVVKLPPERVSELIALKEGKPYIHGGGKIMRDWLAIESGSEEKWFAFAKEAMDFSSSK